MEEILSIDLIQYFWKSIYIFIPDDQIWGFKFKVKLLKVETVEGEKE